MANPNMEGTHIAVKIPSSWCPPNQRWAETTNDIASANKINTSDNLNMPTPYMRQKAQAANKYKKTVNWAMNLINDSLNI